MSKKVHVKTGDTVMVINGKDRGKTGKVMAVAPSEGMLSPEDRVKQAASSRLKALFTLTRYSSSAPSAARL